MVVVCGPGAALVLLWLWLMLLLLLMLSLGGGGGVLLLLFLGVDERAGLRGRSFHGGLRSARAHQEIEAQSRPVRRHYHCSGTTQELGWATRRGGEAAGVLFGAIAGLPSGSLASGRAHRCRMQDADDRAVGWRARNAPADMDKYIGRIRTWMLDVRKPIRVAATAGGRGALRCFTSTRGFDGWKQPHHMEMGERRRDGPGLGSTVEQE